ncbi:MAG: hypothetical protein GY913_14475 [Proteobacteria bacterium]|nr:hypothetical protein [Pseudomonadota bacterium]MCP4918115.1 hypothetical protein [Pseudomonadota bacterium]
MWIHAIAGLFGCTGEDVATLYEDQKAAALADPPALESDWKADAAVRLAEPLVQDLLEQGIEREVDAMGAIDVRIGKLRPKLDVTSIELDEGGCDGCIELEADIAGDAVLRLGAGSKHIIPYTGSFTVEVAFATTSADDGRHIELTVKDVTRFKASLSETKFDLTGPLESWGDTLIAKVDPLDLGAYGGEDLGLRDIRVGPEGGGLLIELHTDANPAGNVARGGALPDQGFEVIVSPKSLLSLAQKAAFEHGEIDHGLYAEPTDLQIKPDSFELAVRLYHLEGGWWRDYTLVGELGVEQGWLTMRATSIEPGDSSRGAAAIDALAVLTEWFVLDMVKDAAQASVPSRERATAGSLGVNAVLTEAAGSGGKLVLRGTATVGPAGKKPVR